jgi:lysophospholipase L1-like esterase
MASLKRVLLLGDSIRMGYQDGVKAKLKGKVEVISPAANCGHSLMLRETLSEWAIQHQPDIIHFNAGIWDLGRIPGSGEGASRFTIAAYVRNLRLVLRRLQKDTNAILIFATTTPILDGPPGVRKRSCVPSPLPARYNIAALSLMNQYGVEVNDLNKIVMDTGVYKCLSEDRIHMTRTGNSSLAAAVARAILESGHSSRS